MRERRTGLLLLGLWVALVGLLVWWAVFSVRPAPIPQQVILSPPSSEGVKVFGARPAAAPKMPVAAQEEARKVRDTRPVPKGRGRIEGTVLETDGRPAVHGSVMVVGPAGELLGTGVREDGRFHVHVVPARYRVFASRWDGTVEVRSDEQAVEVREGEGVSAHFELPGHYSGEPGFVAALHSDGFRVEWVLKDSPAKRLGLSKGDLILQVEGASTLEMSEKEFERAMVGPEGTEVELLVRFEDEQGPWEGVVNLQRSALDGLFNPP